MVRRASLDRWRRKRPADVVEAIAALDDLVKREPHLQAPADCHVELIGAIFERGPAPPPPAWSADSVRLLTEGRPLLRTAAVEWERLGITKRWLRICGILARHPFGEPARALSAGARRGRPEPANLARTLFEPPSPEEGAMRASLAELKLDPDMAANVLRLSLFPVLALWSAAAAELWEAAGWSRGYCPCCGSWPLLAELRGLVQFRRLRCGLCAADWSFDRLACPYCGGRDPAMLGYLQAGDDPSARLDTCEACRGYLKSISRLTPHTSPGLLVADLATVHLDLIARDRGYRDRRSSM